ncbi:MAG: phage holin family protein [Chloroflexota bacterium]
MARHNYDESSADLAADIVERAQQLLRLEIALAKQEAKELAIRNGIAVGLMAGGGMLAVLGLLVGVPVLIVMAFDSWIAALAWVLIYVLGGVGLVLIGKSRLKIEAPQRTLSSLKETRAWVLHQLTTSSR